MNNTHVFNQREKRALFVGLDLETTGTDPEAVKDWIMQKTKLEALLAAEFVLTATAKSVE